MVLLVDMSFLVAVTTWLAGKQLEVLSLTLAKDYRLVISTVTQYRRKV